MKHKLLTLLLLVATHSQASDSLIATIICQTDDMGYVKTYIHGENSKRMDMVELYGPWGLGENFLDSSYVPNTSEYKGDTHELSYTASLPMDGTISFQIDLDKKTSSGTIRFPGSDPKTYELKDCKKE